MTVMSEWIQLAAKRDRDATERLVGARVPGGLAVAVDDQGRCERLEFFAEPDIDRARARARSDELVAEA
jgi:hypothetical protein